MSINDFIARGEGPELEFKPSIRWDRKLLAVTKTLEKVIAKTLAGFMNHKGGTAVIGVTHDGSVVGVEPVMTSLRKQSRDGLSLHLTEVLGKYLGEPVAALVDVTYVRSGSSTRLLDVREATDWIAQRRPKAA
jgi:hypothetical protein